MPTYEQPTLSNFRAEKGYYTTREIAEIYHVTPQTVCNWMRRGWLQGEMREPLSEKAKTTRGRYRIFPQAVEDIEIHREELIEQSRRYWVRLLVKMKKGK
jgi:predicted transcriptional regulator of viral defense system